MIDNTGSWNTTTAVEKKKVKEKTLCNFSTQDFIFL